MTTADIREKLVTYIKVADEKKIKAFYTIIENELEEEYKWWKDVAFTNELDKRSEEYKTGQSKGFTWTEAKKRIEKSTALKLKNIV